MKHLSITESQSLSIRAKETSTPQTAITEALEVCKVLDVNVELNIKGYIICLPNRKTVQQLVAEYRNWVKQQIRGIDLSGKKTTTQLMSEYLERVYKEEGQKFKETSSYYKSAVKRKESAMNGIKEMEKKENNPIKRKLHLDYRDRHRLSAFSKKTEIVLI